MAVSTLRYDIENANNAGDREAIIANALGSTARELLPVSADAAAQVAAKALHYAGPHATANPSHVMTAVDAYLASGQLTPAIDLLRETLEQPLPAGLASEMTCTLAQALIVAGQPGQAAATLERALHRAPPGDGMGGDRMRATLLLALSLCDSPRAGAEAIRLLKDRRGGRAVTAIARATLADLAWQDGAAAEALELARDAVAEAGDGVAPLWRLRARLALASKVSSAGEHAEAETFIRQASAERSRLGPAVDRGLVATALARILTQAGQLRRARQEAELALRVADESDAGLVVSRARCALAAIALRMGDLASCEVQLRQCQERIAAAGPATAPEIARLAAQCMWLDVQLTAERHGPRRAASLLARADPRPVTFRSLLLDEPGAPAWFVRLGIAVRNRPQATRAVIAAEEVASRSPGLAQPVIAARHARGLLDQDTGMLSEAAAGHRDPWARAWAAADLADCLAGQPAADPCQAVPHLQAALDTFERIDANLDAARMRERMRGRGVPAPSAERTRQTWEAFSDTQQEITFLVGQGLTNGQIASRVSLSPHTVNYHLRRIFRMLDVRSRVELAAMARHLQLEPQLEPPSSGS